MKIILAIFALVFSSITQASSLNNMVIFGDSLSDDGNLYELYKIPSSPPYFKGRFSNGPVWIEDLAELYFHENSKAHLQNYAFGGAAIADEDNDGVFSLKLEVDTYLGAHQDKAAANTLYIIWIGANNYLMTPKDADGTLASVNTGIRKSIKTLTKAGAKHIMLVSIPDLGVTPFPSESYSEDLAPAVREKLSSFTRRHNELLSETITELKQSNPEVEWLYFDASSKFKEFLDTPDIYGIRNTKDACHKSDTDKLIKHSMLQIASRVQERTEPGSCDDYLFFDGVHPTARAHKVIAEHAKAYLESEGVELG
ncbi:MAG: SGNH/GDSL hydrolase family protein [Tatlockia sp.]|nr:SGNH/GDSL hydrolase family protein [Tatlockia sp.]